MGRTTNLFKPSNRQSGESSSPKDVRRYLILTKLYIGNIAKAGVKSFDLNATQQIIAPSGN